MKTFIKRKLIVTITSLVPQIFIHFTLEDGGGHRRTGPPGNRESSRWAGDLTGLVGQSGKKGELVGKRKRKKEKQIKKGKGKTESIQST